MTKRYIIPVFIPHYGCPRHCIFCDQRRITGSHHMPDSRTVAAIIESHLSRINEDRHIEVAFYGGSFTALSLTLQRELLAPARRACQAGRINGIRLSTRPDAVTPQIAELLTEHHVSTVELGVQSLDDDVLTAAKRGHSTQHVRQAVAVLKEYRFTVGLQFMPGLPLEDEYSLYRTGIQAVKLEPHFARIYPAIVLSGTPLAEMYRKGSYTPLTLQEAIKRAAFLKVLFAAHHIQVIRTGLQASDELNNPETVMAGPYHPAFGALVDSEMAFQLLLRCLEIIPYNPSVTLYCHRRDESMIRGQANTILRRLAETAGREIILSPNNTVVRGEMVLEQDGRQYRTGTNMIFSKW